MWNKRENGNLDFEGAGQIVSSHTIYSEDLETFIYNSPKEYPDAAQKIQYRSYVSNLSAIATQITTKTVLEFHKDWQKKIFKELFMS